jgi:hypothetical protein
LATVSAIAWAASPLIPTGKGPRRSSTGSDTDGPVAGRVASPRKRVRSAASQPEKALSRVQSAQKRLVVCDNRGQCAGVGFKIGCGGNQRDLFPVRPQQMRRRTQGPADFQQRLTQAAVGLTDAPVGP